MNEIALCAGEDLRLPALFFDKVFLVAGKTFIPNQVKEDLHYLATKKDIDALVEANVHFLHNPTPDDLAIFLRTIGYENPKKLPKSEQDELINNPKIVKDFQHWVIAESATRLSNSAVYLYQKRCREKGIVAYPVFLSEKTYTGYWLDGSEAHVQLNIINMPLIDSTKLSWEHITEIRKDSSFQEKIRRFRLLFASEYQDKDPNFVVDSLHQRIDDYKTACKRHGIDLIVGTLNQMVSSKSTLGAAGLVIIGALTGDPTINNWSVVAGAVLEFSGLAIYVVEKRIEFSRSLAENSISYLIDLKKHGLIK